MKDISI